MCVVTIDRQDALHALNLSYQLFRRLNAGGVTIVQVTHSEENARFGNRVIHLKDGWLTPG